MKKTCLFVIIALILLAIIPMNFIKTVKAIHDAEIYWVDDGVGVMIDTGTKAFSGTLAGGFIATFAVHNLDYSNDSITSVRVVIDRTTTQGVLFHFVRGRVWYENKIAPVPDWTADPTEFDFKGWPGTIIFKALPEGNEVTPLEPGNTYWFELVFDQGPASCSYPDAFKVYTEDPGRTSGTPETELSGVLGVIIDNEVPVISTYPANGDSVNGLLEPCGYHFMWLNITAHDELVHDTGLWNYSIYFDNVLFDSGLINLTRGAIWNYSNRVRTREGWDLSAGIHNFTVTVWDKVYNRASVTITFTYVPPPVPLTISPTSGYAAPETRIINTTTGLVRSQSYTYQSKTLGTLVTVTGIQFGANLPVSVRIYIPTYYDYFATYGTYNVLVNQTTTRADGTFTATFVFPKAPAGVYNITVTTSVMECAVFFEVEPEVIYEPDEVMGPALITVKATGFTAQNTTRPSWLFVVPEALHALNLQVDRNWYIDGNGTLQNSLNDYGKLCVPPQTIENTLYWPFAEPGTYTVEIKHIDGDYWNGRTRTWVYTPCFCGSNTITVKDWTGDILEAAQGAKTAAEGAKSSADAAKSSADAAKSSADAAKSAADAAKSSADAAKSSADAAKSAADAAKSSADAAKSSADSAKSSADSAKGYAQSAAEGIDGAKKAAEGLTIPVYLAVIFSLIAAIIAAACAILVYRKIA